MYSTGEKQKKYYLLFTKIKGARNFSNSDNFLKLQMKKIKNPVRLNSLIFYWCKFSSSIERIDPILEIETLTIRWDIDSETYSKERRI